MSQAKQWFPYGAGKNKKSKIQIFCFYFAGGSSPVFKQWLNISEKIEFIPVELPGRGMRIAEPTITNMADLVSELIPHIYEVVTGPFYFFGHSMGALIAFNTVWELQNYGLLQPEKLIVAGRHAPHKPDPSRLNSKMNDTELTNELIRLNGTPIEILKNSDMMNFLVPMIRNDLKLHESFTYTNQKLRVPILAHCANLDHEANKPIMNHWSEVSESSFEVEEFKGDHFFVQSLGHKYVKKLISSLNIEADEVQMSY